MTLYCCTREKQVFPSVKGCIAHKCPELVEQEYPWGMTTRKRLICNVTGKIPGNMAKCPKEDL